MLLFFGRGRYLFGLGCFFIYLKSPLNSSLEYHHRLVLFFGLNIDFLIVFLNEYIIIVTYDFAFKKTHLRMK
jgi:hypothetical protein